MRGDVDGVAVCTSEWGVDERGGGKGIPFIGQTVCLRVGVLWWGSG